MGTKARRVTLVVTALLTAGAMASGGASVAQAAAAGPAPRGTSATSPVVRSLSASVQAGTRAYWTKARMESATPIARTSPAAGPAAIPNPVHFNGVPTVGALFFTTGSRAHFCTASVVDSFRGDIILTAAHCVYGGSYATNIAYVPEWHDGVSPYGEWPVTSITVASGWITSANQNLDFAFLTVAPKSGPFRPIQGATGGLRLGANVGYSHDMYVIGYNNTDTGPIGCATTSTEFEANQMQFYCNDYWDGTSGGPWILNFNPVTGSGVLFGDIGGYEQGGNYSYLSYSPYYSWSILELFLRAQSNP